MFQLTGWKEGLSLPVIAEFNPQWNLNELEKILTDSIRRCAEVCLEKNNGLICMTLSGGLDSSFCLAKIREIFGPRIPVHTFTVSGSKTYPDFKFANLVSGIFNTIHHSFIPDNHDINRGKCLIAQYWPEEHIFRGDVAVLILYKCIAAYGMKCVTALDGIDELLGGYWDHRRHQGLKEKTGAFQKRWGFLEKNHLIPLERSSRHFGIKVIFPYLQKPVIEYISRIPLDDRTSFEKSKIPLRMIAQPYLPIEILTRKKKGFCDALKK